MTTWWRFAISESFLQLVIVVLALIDNNHVNKGYVIVNLLK